LVAGGFRPIFPPPGHPFLSKKLSVFEGEENVFFMLPVKGDVDDFRFIFR